MEIYQITSDYNTPDFDCEDDDLNKFLVEDAKNYQESRIANTYVLEDEGDLLAYFCLLTDKVSRSDLTNSKWKAIRNRFPNSKRFNSYPSIKIGRFAVSKGNKGKHVGSSLLDTIKLMLVDSSLSGLLPAFRFLTVDAYMSAIPFYERNGFKQLSRKEEDNHTRLMYFDMMEFA